jgi:glutamate synthase domain-containing protein 2
MSPLKQFLTFCLFTAAGIVGLAQYYEWAYWIFVPMGIFYLVGIHDLVQSKRALLRNYPVFGHGRYWLEILRPKFYQYFVESDLNGRPFNRTFRSIIYQRAKHQLDSSPFGTQVDVYEIGHEWINHSVYAVNKHQHVYENRISVGGPACTHPYSASLLNISAMSFGSLSANAVMALNKGAKLGGFAHNTGEGGLSPYHLKHEGDIIWQIGTGYFGCRTKDGKFDPEKFKEKSQHQNVKMIEIKLSQGAKPGKGGILPAAKNSEEIAEIRGVEPHTNIISPPSHSEFSGPKELLEFIHKLRGLSGGKPVGIKMCIGNKHEFEEVCEEMVKLNIMPDFIAIDGSEGGTGAAPLEFANSVGTPLKEGLTYAYDTLVGYGIKEHIKLIAAGKIVTSFHIARVLALGADLCYSARGMMMALGCIQALSCNTNHCPVGIATQNKDLARGLHVDNKAERIHSYHKETLKSFEEMLAAAGMKDHTELKRRHIFRRVSMLETRNFEEIYPYKKNGSLLKKAS